MRRWGMGRFRFFEARFKFQDPNTKDCLYELRICELRMGEDQALGCRFQVFVLTIYYHDKMAGF